jgi:hypothetical protein
VDDPGRPWEVFMDLSRFMPDLSNSQDSPAHKNILPRTITDAIEVTRLLGMQYLWVDAEELDSTVLQMDLVYKGAKLTIVAAAGNNNQASLTRSHQGAYNWKQITEKVLGVTVMHAQPPLSWVLQQATWSSRAWTFQEEKFSKRQLIFSDTGIYWKCRKETWTEDSTIPDPLNTTKV